MGDERDRVDEFEGALVAWAERPPRGSPEEAGRRVLEAARQRQRRSRAVRALLATAALVVLALSWASARRPVPGGSPPEAPPSRRALGAGQALIWLDAETPLYMTFEAPGTAPGGGP